MVLPIAKLNLYDTCAVLPRLTRAIGTDRRNLSIHGTTLLVSVYIEASDAGASLDVQLFQTTSGFNETGEAQAISAIHTFTAADVGLTKTFLVTRIHHKPYVTATLTVGGMTYGVYATPTEYTDIDSIITDGALPVIEAGAPFHDDGSVSAVAETQAEVLAFTVPAGTTRKIRQVVGTACAEGIFELKITGGATLAIFGTSPSNITVPFKFDPAIPIAPGSEVKLFFTANEDNPTSTVYGFVHANDFI